MTLYDIISDLDIHPEDHIIYAAPIGGKWKADSPAALLPFPEDGEHLRSLGHDHEGMLYMIEVFLAIEVVDEWCAQSGVEFVDTETKVQVVAYYAEYEAYPQLDAVAA